MYHRPVLIEESINGLKINPNGIYIDVTFGGGGHSKEILNHLNSSGRLIACDQDQDAVNNKIFLFNIINPLYMFSYILY